MSPSGLLAVYCVAILLASLAGGLVPQLMKLTHKRLELAVSFVAGVMLGVGVLHLLPHAVMSQAAAIQPNQGAAAALDHAAIHQWLGPIMLWLLAGFLAMFFMERFFSFHQHEAPQEESNEGIKASRHQASKKESGHTHRHRLTWTGAAMGLSLHSLIEGIALAASVEVVRAHAHGHANDGTALAGLATFLVIFLHKPLDSLTIGTLMTAGGRSIQSRNLVNSAFSLLVPAGAALFYLGLQGWGDGEAMIAAALAFSAGTFLCISMSDLLPELHFHQHDRGKLSAALLLGLALAWLMAVLEAGVAANSHSQHGTAQPTLVPHDHDGDGVTDH